MSERVHLLCSPDVACWSCISGSDLVISLTSDGGGETCEGTRSMFAGSFWSHFASAAGGSTVSSVSGVRAASSSGVFSSGGPSGCIVCAGESSERGSFCFFVA